VLAGFERRSSNGLMTGWEDAEMGDTDFTADAAIDLADVMGCRVFPVRCDKTPLILGWPQRASNDPVEIERMFGDSRIDKVGIAIVTGKGSNLAVIDIDTGPGKDGRLWLSNLNRELPSTVMSETPSGGRHLFFRFPNFDHRNSTSLIAPGVDTRGEGGYIVAPPSYNLKGRYRWLIAPEKGGQSIAAFPDWLSARLERRTLNFNGGQYRFLSWERAQRQVMGPISEGTRNQELTRRCGILCKVQGATFDWVRTTLHEINARCCNPPLSPREVDTIARSIWKREFGSL
jgi:putative DNA primase/helicase